MRRSFRRILSLAAPILAAALLLAACGGGSSAPPPTTEQVLSTFDRDGELMYGLVSGTPNFWMFNPPANAVPLGDNVIQVGVDFNGDEHVGILDFPVEFVPPGARIVSSTLDLYRNFVEAGFRLRVELVDLGRNVGTGSAFTMADYTFTSLVGSLWDNTSSGIPTLMAIEVPLAAATTGGHAAIDVTPLVAEALRRADALGVALPRCQFRLRLTDPAPLVYAEFVDPDPLHAADRQNKGPLLEVSYR